MVHLMGWKGGSEMHSEPYLLRWGGPRAGIQGMAGARELSEVPASRLLYYGINIPTYSFVAPVPVRQVYVVPPWVRQTEPRCTFIYSDLLSINRPALIF